jgi:hypothetical protein
MKGSPNTRPQGPASPQSRYGNKLSQRGMFSIAMMLFSVGGLTIAMLAGARLVQDILGEGLANYPLDGLVVKVVAVGLAYSVGWFTAMLAIRVYGNLVLPLIMNFFIWATLAGIGFLYLQILIRLFKQAYELPKFIAYLAIMGAALGGMVGLHLIVEGHDLRPLSIPLMIINLIQLGFIVYRYVFTLDAKLGYIIYDLIFFIAMSAFSIFMLAHIGLLEPLRRSLTGYFDRNSKVIRTED